MVTLPADLATAAVPSVRAHRPRRQALWALVAVIAVIALIALIAGQQRSGVAGAPRADRGTEATVAAQAEIAAVLARPQAYKPIPVADAMAQNAARPLDPRRLEIARPFLLPLGSADWERAANCLALANYYEAASEGDSGMRAVSQVVLNRLRHPTFPHAVCDVVFQGAERATGCQFTFACDGSMQRPPSPGLFARARAIAEQALNGRVEASVGMATHYHANFVVPYWADSLDKIRTLGNHIFYVWRGPMGNRAAFRAEYAGESPGSAASALAVQPGAPDSKSADGPTALALAADRINLTSAPSKTAVPERTHLVADEGMRSLKADDNVASSTLRAQPLLARSPERALSDGQ